MTWLKFLSSDAGTDTLIVCLPPGGRGSSGFQSWRAVVPGSAQLAVVRPPGREERLTEPALTDVVAYTMAVAEHIQDTVDGRRLVLVGACLGGMLAYETCRRLLARDVAVDLLCAVAAIPPGAYRRHDERRSTDEGMALLRQWDGTDAEVLDNPEFARVLLPAIMADLRLGDSYDGIRTPALPVRMLAVAGAQDKDAAPELMTGWAAATTEPLVAHTRPGGHFIHHDEAAWIAGRALNLLQEATDA